MLASKTFFYWMSLMPHVSLAPACFHAAAPASTWREGPQLDLATLTRPSRRPVGVSAGLAGLVMCFRNWTYTLFYVAAELWVRASPPHSCTPHAMRSPLGRERGVTAGVTAGNIQMGATAE